MERQLSGELQDGDRTEIEFALGKALEDEKRFEASFKHYQAGNQLASKRFRFDDEATRRNFEAVKDVFTEDFYRSRPEFGDADPAPIFIVGLQRSGSTLLEQILSAHSQVDGTQELKFVTALIRNLKNTIGPDEDDAYRKSMEAIDADMAERLGQTYLKQLAPYRKSGRFFTDKLPDNFKHVGFIKLILPHAKIIDARRHPMACGFSCFKQLFSSGAEFSYSLEDMGTYYRLYDDLMSHFNEVLPGQILRVNNEDVIEDLEGEVRRILDFLGLEFEEACLNYHKQDRAVFTPSASQVRKPISRSGMEQWKNFDPWLGPLREALGDLVYHSSEGSARQGTCR